MDAEQQERLTANLREYVASFYRKDKRHWKEPVVSMLRRLREANVDAVFFGGTLRSLLASRIIGKGSTRPRDVDIVISGESMDSVRDLIVEHIERETRFGGLQVKERGWQFDLWPVHKTWAFVKDCEADREFSNLPNTTFFNLEAIAVDVWPKPGKSRSVYAGDGQFFDGIANRLIEINREDNPFPSLCVVRALVMASSLDFDLGPNLTRYIAHHGQLLSCNEIREVQHSHYGKERMLTSELYQWVRYVVSKFDGIPCARTKLPRIKQLQFWPDDTSSDGKHEKPQSKVRFRLLTPQQK